MNEQTQTMDDLRSSTLSSLSQAAEVDWSQYKDSGSTSEEAATTTLSKPDDRGASEASKTKESSQSEQTGDNSNELNSDRTAATRIDEQEEKVESKAPPQKESRENARIRELNEASKSKDAKIAELEKKLNERLASNDSKKEPVQVKKPKVEPPKAPEYSREVLRKIVSQARANGDFNLLDQAESQLEAWNKYDLDMIKHEIANGEAIKQHNGLVNYYKQETLKKWPSLSDGNSDHVREYAGLRGWVEKEMPDLLEYPVSEYVLGMFSDWKLQAQTASNRMAAVVDENKKLKEENDRLKKGSLPLSSNTSNGIKRNGSSNNDVASINNSLRDELSKIGFSNSF